MESSQYVEHLVKKFMLYFLILLVTAAGYSGYFSKWSFRDGNPEMGIEAVLENTAARPNIYRKLLPEVVKGISNRIPVSAKQKMQERLLRKNYVEKIYAEAKVPAKYIIEYYLMIVVSFISFYFAVLILRNLLSEVTQDKVAGTLAALLFALLIPVFDSVGGYYYDFPEMLFMFSAVYLGIKGHWLPIVFLSVIATINKEAFFWFIPTLYPFLREKLNVRKTVGVMGICFLFAGLAALYIHQLYDSNPGGMVMGFQTHVWQQLYYISNPKTYFLTSTTYGLPFPSRFFFLYIIFVVCIVKNVWNKIPRSFQLHVKIAASINLPLFLLFCYPGELRNLSFLYLSLMVMIAYYIKDSIKSYYYTDKPF